MKEDNLLIRCPVCGRENWAPAVATGQCSWCGYKKGVGIPKEK